MDGRNNSSCFEIMSYRECRLLFLTCVCGLCGFFLFVVDFCCLLLFLVYLFWGLKIYIYICCCCFGFCLIMLRCLKQVE